LDAYRNYVYGFWLSQDSYGADVVLNSECYVLDVSVNGWPLGTDDAVTCTVGFHNVDSGIDF
jgi:hypothetical protein